MRITPGGPVPDPRDVPVGQAPEAQLADRIFSLDQVKQVLQEDRGSGCNHHEHEYRRDGEEHRQCDAPEDNYEYANCDYQCLN